MGDLANLPAQPINLAAAVPGAEEDCPGISRSPIIRNQSLQGAMGGVGMVGMSIENKLTRDDICDWWL